MEPGQQETLLLIRRLANQSDHVLNLLVHHRLLLKVFEHLEHGLNFERQH